MESEITSQGGAQWILIAVGDCVGMTQGHEHSLHFGGHKGERIAEIEAYPQPFASRSVDNGYDARYGSTCIHRQAAPGAVGTYLPFSIFVMVMPAVPRS